MIVRDSDIGVQVFMMKRSLRSSFGGIWVFPGGILEDQDQDIAKKNYCNGIDEKKAIQYFNKGVFPDLDRLYKKITEIVDAFSKIPALIKFKEWNYNLVQSNCSWISKRCN